MQLRVVIVSLGGPVSAGRVTTRSALQMARASAMYADQILLVSPWADVAERLHGIRQQSSTIKALWQKIAEDPRLSEVITDDPALRRFLQEAGSIVSTDHPVDADIAELISAGGDGLVEHRSLMRTSEDQDTLLNRILDQLVPLLADPEVHAVFDARAQAIVGAHLAQHPDLVPESVGVRHREAEMGVGLIARLPAFPQIPLDEISDIKAELAVPLTRYRSKVVELQLAMRQEIASVDTDAEITAEWRRSVAPALADLRDSMVEHSFARELARTTATSARDLVISGASLSLALSALTNVAAAVTAAAAPVGMSLQATSQALVARASKRAELRRSDYYYLFQLQRVGESFG